MSTIFIYASNHSWQYLNAALSRIKSSKVKRRIPSCVEVSHCCPVLPVWIASARKRGENKKHLIFPSIRSGSNHFRQADVRWDWFDLKLVTVWFGQDWEGSVTDSKTLFQFWVKSSFFTTCSVTSRRVHRLSLSYLSVHSKPSRSFVLLQPSAQRA